MIVILLPAYNEAESIGNLFHALGLAIERVNQKFKIIVCDDGSTDKTLEQLIQAQALFKRKYSVDVMIVRHERNRGLGETMRDLIEIGLENSFAQDVLIRMDCDNTHNPKYIEAMVKKIEEGYDVVIASRFQSGGGHSGLSRFRKLTSLSAKIFMKTFFNIKNVREYTCGFRAYKHEILNLALAEYGNNFIQLKDLGFVCTLEKLVKLHLLNARITEIPFILEYGKKQSGSKMVFNITLFGYIVMAILYRWPKSGWKSVMKNRN